MPDKVKPLKFETPDSGTDFDLYPSETDPFEDYIASKGIAFENNDEFLIDIFENEITFSDPINGKIKVSSLININDSLFDNDKDTGIYVEQFPDEDIIRFVNKGILSAIFDPDGIFIVNNNIIPLTPNLGIGDSNNYFNDAHIEHIYSPTGDDLHFHIDEDLVIKNNSDNTIFKVENNAITTFYNNINFALDSLYSIGNQTIRPDVIYTDRININDDSSLPDYSNKAINIKLTGNGSSIYSQFYLSDTGVGISNNLYCTANDSTVYATGIQNTIYVTGSGYNSGSLYGNRTIIFDYQSNIYNTLCGTYNLLYLRYPTVDNIYAFYGYIFGNTNVSKGYGGYFLSSRSAENYGVMCIGDTAAVLVQGHIKTYYDSLYDVGTYVNRFRTGYFDNLEIGDGTTNLFLRSDGSLYDGINTITIANMVEAYDNISREIEISADNTTQVISSGGTDIIFSLQSFVPDSNYFTILPGNTEISIVKSGKYEIKFKISAVGTVAMANTENALYINKGSGYNIVNHSIAYGLYRNSGRGESSSMSSVIINLDAGDKLKIHSKLIYGNGAITKPYASNFNIVRVGPNV